MCAHRSRLGAPTTPQRGRPPAPDLLYEDNDLAVIAHGNAIVLYPDRPDFAELDGLQRGHGQSPSEWGE